MNTLSGVITKLPRYTHLLRSSQIGWNAAYVGSRDRALAGQAKR